VLYLGGDTVVGEGGERLSHDNEETTSTCNVNVTYPSGADVSTRPRSGRTSFSAYGVGITVLRCSCVTWYLRQRLCIASNSLIFKLGFHGGAGLQTCLLSGRENCSSEGVSMMVGYVFLLARVRLQPEDGGSSMVRSSTREDARVTAEVGSFSITLRFTMGFTVSFPGVVGLRFGFGEDLPRSGVRWR
jgi:hypothetical protein